MPVMLVDVVVWWFNTSSCPDDADDNDGDSGGVVPRYRPSPSDEKEVKSVMHVAAVSKPALLFVFLW